MKTLITPRNIRTRVWNNLQLWNENRYNQEITSFEQETIKHPTVDARLYLSIASLVDDITFRWDLRSWYEDS